MCSKCDDLQVKILEIQQLLAEPIDAFTAEQLTMAVSKLESKKAALHPAQKEEPSAVPLSEETQQLLGAADRAIEQSRAVVAQTKVVHADCAAELRAQELRFAFRRGLGNPSRS
jgi:hypothetical protein